MAEKEVSDGFGFRLGERLWPVVGVAAGVHGGPTASPLVSEIPVGIDTHAVRLVRVDGASLAPKSVRGARKLITCGIKLLVSLML